IAEFVNDEGNAAAFGIFQEMANEGRLPRAKKAGDDRCRDFDGHFGRDFGKTIHEYAPGPLAVGGCFNWGSQTNPAPSPAAGSRPGIDEWLGHPAGPRSIERQVSWLADHCLAPPSQVAVARIPVAYRRKATR